MTLVLPAVIAASASNVVVDVNLDNVTHQLNPSALAPTDPPRPALPGLGRSRSGTSPLVPPPVPR